MSVVSGQVTFGATGTIVLSIGMAAKEVDFYVGSRNGVTEADGLLSIGHADQLNQFCHMSKDAKADRDTTHCLVAYNSAGAKVLEAKITGWGTSTITFNVTIANNNYPFDIVARS